MQLTDLQLSARTHAVLADLAHEAAANGATTVPIWWTRDIAIADGTLRSDDDTAIRDLDIWRALLDTNGRLDTYTCTQDGQLCRAWHVAGSLEDISIHIFAITPITVETRPHNAPEPYRARLVEDLMAVAA
jgi:hypothetical protein